MNAILWALGAIVLVVLLVVWNLKALRRALRLQDRGGDDRKDDE
ncbi:hypothetical protein [Maritimibacter sp. 55A14]|nr:hypothetical protein [Maritimibacter sp. 55A14]